MHGVSVVELAGGVAGAWCGRLLGQMGAEVFVVEPPAGSALRTRPPLLAGESPWHHWLNGAKTSLVAEGDEAERLASGADCVIYTVPEDAVAGEVEALAERLRRDRPGQVFVALSGFGLTGPWRSLASSELTEWAAGGHLYLTGDRDREPIQGGGPWPQYFAAANAVIAVQAALMQAGRTGNGQVIDIGLMEAMAAAHQWSVSTYTQHGYIKRRDGNRLAESYHPLGVYQCSDGWLQLACASAEQWEALCILTDCVELLADDALLVPAGRYDRADEIDAAIGPWFGARTCAQAVADLQEVRVPGPAIVVGPRKPSEPLVAPAIGSGQDRSEQLARRGPVSLPDVDLAGVRVLEFSVAWAGPLAGRYLADLGADVIKVEHPTARGLGVVPGGVAGGWSWGDLPPAAVRNGTWPATDPGDRWFNRLAMFNKLQRNKRSLCLDVKAPGGEALLHRLVAESDVVLNNYSPRGVKSLGIDHDSLSAVNPNIITISMSGYGATGPMATHFSLGPILETHAGLASTTGYPDRGPLRIGVAFPDPVGGLSGTIATLAALWDREVTGVGSAVDLSQLETLLPVIGDHLLTTSVTGELPTRIGNRSATHAPQGVYRCGGDDNWLAITVRSDDEWERLVELLGDDRLAAAEYRTVAGRHEHHDAIDELLTAWTAPRGRFEAMAALQARGVAAMAVLTNADMVDGPQLQARGFIATIESDDAGPQRLPGCPIHFSDREIPLGPAPTLGQHNEDIARELLGYDGAGFAELVAEGALATAPPT